MYTAWRCSRLVDDAGESHLAMFILALGSALNVALILVAIPRYGALGAAWVTVVPRPSSARGWSATPT